MTRVIANVVVGRADTAPDKPSHVSRVAEGNSPRRARREPGFRDLGDHGVGTSRRSTGINARYHGPIDPRMPNLSPP